MWKKISSIILVGIISCISFSCKEGKSLQELLQEEIKAIDKFITMNNLVILKEYPKNGVFGEKEYFRTNEGLFFQVVDSGNGTKIKLADDVSVRYDYYQLIKDVAQGDATEYNFPCFYSNTVYYNYGCNAYCASLCTHSSDQPYSFVFGLSQTYSPSYSPVCQAWVIPLSYVGEEAVLNLIIPSSLGSSDNNQSVIPVFYKNLRYTRFN